MPELLNAAAASLLQTVLNSVVFAIIPGALMWVFATFARGVNAATRHVICWAVLLAVLAIPLVNIAVARLEPANPALEVTASIDTPTPTSSPAPTPSASVDTSIGPPIEAPSRSFQLPFEIRVGYLPLCLVGGWAIFCILQFARIVSSYMYLRRLKRESQPAARELRLSFDEWKLACGVDRDVRLLVSDEVTSPLAAGFLRPAVILPRALAQNLPSNDLDHVVLHELAHLARRDDWTNLLARILCAIVGVHPVAAWMLRRIDTEREVACDDWVVQMTGAAKPYAASLARLVEFRLSRRRELLATGIGGRRSELTARIERLVTGNSDFSARTSMFRVGFCTVVLGIVVLFAAHGPQWIAFAQDAPPEPPQAPAAPIQPIVPAAPQVAPAAVPVPPIPAVGPVLAGEVPPPHAPAHAAAPRLFHLPQAPHAPLHEEYAFAMPPPVPPAAMAQAAPAAPAKPGGQPPPPPAAPPVPPARGPSYLASLAEAGYNDLSVEDVIDLKTHGVTAAYMTAMNKAGWGRLTTRQLIDLRVQGANPEYVQSMAGVGLKNLTLKDVFELRAHGVRADWVREIHALGFGPYDVRQIKDFAIHGTSVDFFRSLKEAGFVQAEPREILDARIHGVTASDLREAKKYGSNLTLQKIIRLKTAGVL